MFKRLDVNQDRQLTADEIPDGLKERLKPMLQRADKNDDKKVTFEEFTEMAKKRRPGPPRADGPPHAYGPPRGDWSHRGRGRPGPPHGYGPPHAYGPPRGDWGHRGRPGPPDAKGPGPRHPDPKAVFARLDTNKDGQLNPEEFARGMKRLHHMMAARHGRPGDQFGPPRGRRPGPPPGAHRGPHGERMAHMAKMGKELFERADANKDGKVAIDEVPEARREGFERLLAKADKDGDKALSVEEARRMHAAMAQRARSGRPGPPDARRGRPDGKHGPRGPRAGVVERFKAADKNSDGKLSKEEAPGPLKERFEKIDADSDGQLTPEELRKAWEARKAKSQG